MIIVRAPLRISFVGGGSDLAEFYRVSTGKVISATVDKYVYVVINPAPLLKGITARYSAIENVKKVNELKNDRMREVMLKLKIKDNMEIGVFSDLPVGTGMGGSSSFTVALIKGLSTYLGKRLDKEEIAKIACEVEINSIKEPIGKQDQYASVYGGLNTIQFNKDETVEVDPVLIDYKTRIDLENHMLVFFTGITRQASSVLTEQKSNIKNKVDTLKAMVDLVDIFKKKLMVGDFESLGKLLHENWLKKKALASKVSSSIIDKLYDAGIQQGAWGGKVLGAGGGGCILFLSPVSMKQNIRQGIIKKAKELQLSDFQEMPIKFTQSGVEVISNSYIA